MVKYYSGNQKDSGKNFTLSNNVLIFNDKPVLNSNNNLLIFDVDPTIAFPNFDPTKSTNAGFPNLQVYGILDNKKIMIVIRFDPPLNFHYSPNVNVGAPNFDLLIPHVCMYDLSDSQGVSFSACLPCSDFNQGYYKPIYSTDYTKALTLQPHDIAPPINSKNCIWLWLIPSIDGMQIGYDINGMSNAHVANTGWSPNSDFQILALSTQLSSFDVYPSRNNSLAPVNICGDCYALPVSIPTNLPKANNVKISGITDVFIGDYQTLTALGKTLNQPNTITNYKLIQQQFCEENGDYPLCKCYTDLEKVKGVGLTDKSGMQCIVSSCLQTNNFTPQNSGCQGITFCSLNITAEQRAKLKAQGVNIIQNCNSGGGGNNGGGGDQNIELVLTIILGAVILITFILMIYLLV